MLSGAHTKEGGMQLVYMAKCEMLLKIAQWPQHFPTWRVGVGGGAT